ncbi:ABC transporter permease [Cohnella caldifontis]|uniref:ABC transporter permease n=1 Tax=Cohnella caldifontis TaxID=3027471 RepID=UPI0023EE1ABD|nr:ABC transporter permease [Cohnella sp. YIM B05605]
MKAWTPISLALDRILRFWNLQARAWRTALDWTVWIYFIVPGLLYAVGTYRAWWLYPPDWLTGLPAGLAALPTLLLALTGQLRVLVEEADILFLRQRLDWMRSIMGIGAAYTFLMHVLQSALAFGLLSLWLVRIIGLGAGPIAAWALYTAAYRTLFSVAGNLIRAYWRGWRRYAVLTAAVILAGGLYLLPVSGFLAARDPAYLWGAAAITLAAAALAAAFKLGAKGTFANDLLMERQAKLATADLLLQGVMERKPTVQLARPLLFRRSGRLFRGTDAGTVLGEARIKSFLRKWANVQLWFSFHSASTAAILMSPGWLAPAVAAVLPFIAAAWIREQWREWAAEPFISQFPWSGEDLRKGSSRSGFWLLIAGFVWLAAAAGGGMAGWPGLPIGAVCGLAYGFALLKLMEKLRFFP